MIKKSESEIRSEMAHLRRIASMESAPEEVARQAATASDALYWLLDTDAGSTSVADRLGVILPAEEPRATSPPEGGPSPSSGEGSEPAAPGVHA